ncbi:hypothetical protein QTP86_029247 [Hemibagrus guttatus]|nr:hypothetical protein QTP86_029247 [Hemibagrus guttatus]
MVILVLSTVSSPLESFYERGSMRLYRSEDYGKSFHDISYTISNSFIRKDFGISVGPGNSQKLILTAELPVANVPGGVIFTSTDSGKAFKSVQLPFHPAQPISFHHQNSDYLLVICTQGSLWLSQNFGRSWSKIHDGVYSFTWGFGYTLFFSYSPKGTGEMSLFMVFPINHIKMMLKVKKLNITCVNGLLSMYFLHWFVPLGFQIDVVEADRRGNLFLRRTQDLGQTFMTIAQNIFSFGYIGGFLFTSVMENPGSPRAIYVSVDNGDQFTKALLPSATSEQFYSVLDGDEDMIFMHVDSPGDETYFGTVYTSDDRGILYSKSLERHLFGGERKSDFTNVTSLRGVYLTNVFEEDGQICTVITFNNGGKWWPLKKPKNMECEESIKKCNLHIHGEHSHYSGISPMLPLSHPSAVGLIIAHGSVGESISASEPDVYVSSDGGYNWICALRGPHHYSILDSGGLIVAVEVRRDRQTNAIKFSTDEGQCWKTYNFTEHPIYFAGLTSEPGTKTLKISVFGYRPDDDDQPLWVAVTIDFEQLLPRECNEQDYLKWLAHSDDEQQDSETDGCVLGYKETFQRLKKMSVCRKGNNYVVSKQHKPCPCSREDYMWYRKIPSDKCEGGFTPPRQIDAAKMHCGNNSQPSIISHQPNIVKEVWLLIVISVSVGTVSLAIITAVTITVLRMNYRQRSTSYQFSALQLHEDEMCVAFERTPNSNQAIYQEDSDDDLIL